MILLGDGRELLRRVLDDPPDFVWNMAEGQGVGRSREARVPAALEMLGIPYSGSDPLTLAASLDKDVRRRLVRVPGGPGPQGDARHARADPGATERALGVRVLRPGRLPRDRQARLRRVEQGIRGRCLADSAAEAVAAALRLADEYEQPVLVEEFIDGDEVTVGLVGNGERVEVLGAMRIVPKGSAARFVYSLEVKRDWRRRVDYEAPALLPAGVDAAADRGGPARVRRARLPRPARIDFRLRDGVPYFIEANPLPGLAPVTSDLVILARGHGLGHADLIRKVLHTASSVRSRPAREVPEAGGSSPSPLSRASLRVAVLHNAPALPPSHPDAVSEADVVEVALAVVDALRREGLDARPLAAAPPIGRLVESLAATRVPTWSST